MLALRYSMSGGLRVCSVHQPCAEPPAGCAIVKVIRAGICRTDIEICGGYMSDYDLTVGHEFVGVVESVHITEEQKSNTHACALFPCPGARVVSGINISCCFTYSYKHIETQQQQNDAHHNNNISTHPFPPPPTPPFFSPPPSSSSLFCSACAAGGSLFRNHCPTRRCLGIVNYDGVICERVVLPLENLVEVPPVVTNKLAVFAEPLAAALRIFEQIPDVLQRGRGGACSRRDSSRVAVMGDGKLGLLICHVLQIMIDKQTSQNQLDQQQQTQPQTQHQPHHQPLPSGCSHSASHGGGATVVLFGHHRSRISLSPDQTHKVRVIVRADDAVSHNACGSKCGGVNDDPVEFLFQGDRSKITEITTIELLQVFENYFDVCVDASGNPDTINTSALLCRPEGLLLMKTTCAHHSVFHSSTAVCKELTMVGSRCGPMDEAVNLLSSGKLDHISEWVTHEIELKDAVEAVQLTRDKAGVEVHVLCGG
eukprot:GHVS01009616.1.p1 GENE.GHVS01009616.1~~GHVS01009616.1.p1  ORF type:complete len:482 (-),score=87.91 GHVS01009616.1:175-1620(-)